MKFGEKTHLENFRNNGLLYMNSEDYFRKLEKDPVRCDKFEGIDRFYQPSFIKSFTIGSPGKKQIILGTEDLVGPITIRLPRYRCNLFCMSAITDPRKHPIVDERNFGFGDSVVLIKDTQAFIDLVVSSGIKFGLNITCCLVEYFDPDFYSGNIEFCKKSNAYSYQNEFRFIVSPGTHGPLTLELGNIADISTEILSLRDINKTLKFHYDEGDNP